LSAHIEFAEKDLHAMTEQCWAAYLDPEGITPLLPADRSGRAFDVSASVSVTGEWNGHVVVECSAKASEQAAAAMLSIEATDVTPGDVADALGEIANVIGGGVKSLLPDPCALSLPHVVAAAGHQRLWPTVTEVCRLDATWQNEPIAVTILESRSDG
jgi:chemotaxis protein CheX